MTTRRPKTAVEFLTAAAAIIRQRAKTHGKPVATHRRIAGLWNAYLAARPDPAAPLSAEDVAMLLAFVKIARRLGGKKNADNPLDMLGYIAVSAEVAAAELVGGRK